MVPKPSLAQHLHLQLVLQKAPMGTEQTHQRALEMKLLEKDLIITLSDFLQRGSKGTGKGKVASPQSHWMEATYQCT